MNIRYVLNGVTKSNDPVRIEIGDEVWQGDVIQLPLTSVYFSRSQGDGLILATSLSIKTQSVNDGDCDDLYVRSSTKWQVVLYVNDKISWKGHILREVRKTQYIDSPAQYVIEATDGVGTLKEITYRASYNRVTFESILYWIASRTENNIDVDVYFDYYMYGSNSTLFQHAYINDAIFDGKSVYEMLEMFSEALGCYFTQLNGDFKFLRTDNITNNGLETRAFVSEGGYPEKLNMAVFGPALKNDILPIDILSEGVEPAKKRIPLKFVRDGISGMGDSNMIFAHKKWVTSDTVYNLFSIGGQRQLRVSRGVFQNEVKSVGSPSYPLKLRISACGFQNTSVRNEVFIVVYFKTPDYVYAMDWNRSITDDNPTRWRVVDSISSTKYGQKHSFKGSYNFVGGNEIPNYYRLIVTEVEKLELEIDATNSLYQGTAGTLGVKVYFDKDNKYSDVTHPATRSTTGVFLRDIGVYAEAFNSDEYYMNLVPSAIDDTSSVDLPILESTDDNGSQYFIPGVVTDVDNLPIHYVGYWDASPAGYRNISLTEFLLSNLAKQNALDRVVLEGEMLGSNLERYIFYKDAGNNKKYIATSFDYDIINRSASLTLLQIGTINVNYSLISKDDVEDATDTISPVEYRLDIIAKDVTPAGGNVNVTALLQKREWGILRESIVVTPIYTKEDTNDYTDIVNGLPYFFSQPLVVGNDRYAMFSASYTTPEGIIVSSLFSVKQSPNYYVVLSSELTQAPNLRFDESGVYSKGGSLVGNYDNYKFKDRVRWASGPTASVVRNVIPKFTISSIDPIPDVELFLSATNEGGLVFINFGSSMGVSRTVVLSAVDDKGLNKVDISLYQSADYVPPTSIRLSARNYGSNYNTSIVSNPQNKGKIAATFEPYNTVDDITYTLVSGGNYADVDRYGIITVKPAATTGDNVVIVSGLSEGGLRSDVSFKVKYNIT